MYQRDEAGYSVSSQLGSGVEQTHYTVISAELSCVKDEIYIRSMEDVTEISGPSLVIGTQTQTEAFIWEFDWSKFHLFSSHVR